MVSNRGVHLISKFSISIFIAVLLTLFFSTSHANSYNFSESNNSDMNSQCRLQCAHFYRVNRPIAPFVYHVFVGAELNFECADQSVHTVQRLYGAPKGNSDLKYFMRYLATPHPRRMELINSYCDEDAENAVSAAKTLTQAWKQRLENDLYFYAAMITTPVTGRICAKAASEVEEALQSLD